MFLNRSRLIYSFSSVKPASLLPQCKARWTRYSCTEIRKGLKPEDTFGDYFGNAGSSYPEDDDENEFKGSDLKISEAIFKIKKFMKESQFDQAKEVFDELSKRKRPPPYVYKLLFAFAARLGKAEEAFKLYNDLKKRALYPDGAIFTSLFYACAKCPRSDIALPIANKLTVNLFESKHHKPNSSNFNAMLMAYGRHGDISTVMQIIDTLESERKRLTDRCFNLAMDCCVSQKNSGLRFAILIWHHMLRKKVVPNWYTFTILGRCVRDCSLGDSDLCGKFIDSIFQNYSKGKISQGPKKKLSSGSLEINLNEESKSYENDQRGGNIKEISSFSNNKESKQADSVLDVQNNGAETIQSTLVNENDEKTLPDFHSIKEESSNSFSSGAGNKDESRCLDLNEIAVCEEAVTLSAGNNEGLIHLSETEDRSQNTEIQSGREFNSEVKTHRFDDIDLPNLLTLKPPGKSIINYGNFSTPASRLMLFGGLNGFLETVKKHNVKPGIKLFSILLECIPPTREDEEELMRKMKDSRVKADTTFLNILIRRRILRNEESTPEEFLELFKKYRRVPDALTFGTIALSCVTYESGKKCIELARSHNIRLSNAILGCLLKNAGKIQDMVYVSDILKAAKEDNVEVDAKFVSNLKNILENKKKMRKHNS